MVFLLPDMVAALCLYNSAAKAHLCYHGGMSSFSRLVSYILNLDYKHGITLILAYILTHLNVEADFHWEDWFQIGTFFLAQFRLHSNYGVNRRWICWDPHVPINVEHFQPPLDISVE